MSVPISLLTEQGRMLRTLGRIALKSALPVSRPKQNPDEFPDIEQTVPAPSERLLQHYLAWSGADRALYQNCLPPHLFTQFALPACAPQLEQLRYNLSGIINQGCALRIHAPLAKGQPLSVRCKMQEVREDDGRARIKQQLHISTPAQPNALEVDMLTTFIIGKRLNASNKAPRQEKMEKIANWHAAADDGWQFALLTGDLNPIHWLSPVAKLSPFKSKVLHGFGSFVRSFEALQRDLAHRGQSTITEAEVRFIRPVPLPSQSLLVLRGIEPDERGSRPWVLQDNEGNDLMVGRFCNG